jgi:hypothetical protein
VTDKAFQFGATIMKAEQDKDGDWVFEGVASLPGKDLQGEEVIPEGLEIDYLLGKGLPPGAGGFINYDHQPETIVGVPLDGKIDRNGFWLKWKALKTPLMQKIVEQMKAMKEAGWPRRYGMSIEGVVKEYYKNDPSRIKRAFIRNVALTPTPVHPGTFVDFAKSLSAGSVVAYQPIDTRRQAVLGWSQDVLDIANGRVLVKSHNPYFRRDGIMKRDRHLDYFRDVYGMSESQAAWCAWYAATRESLLVKSLQQLHQGLTERSRGHPLDVIQAHLRDYKATHPDCPHVTEDGRIKGGLRTAARHFYGCEHRSGAEVNAILALMREGY